MSKEIIKKSKSFLTVMIKRIKFIVCKNRRLRRVKLKILIILLINKITLIKIKLIKNY